MRLGVRTATRIHVWLYRATGGRVGRRIGSVPILLLTTVGRTSGKAHTIPVSFVDLEDRIAICAANLGSDRPPAWFRNLLHDPTVEVTIGKHTHVARARVATADERDDLWARLVEQLPTLAAYQEKATRIIPVVLLEPSSGSAQRE